MRDNRAALWLLLASQALFLVGSVIEPPSGVVLILLRVVVPIVVIAYLGLQLARYGSPKGR
jgi:hypothetical protein